jgi:hypothetical protein
MVMKNIEEILPLIFGMVVAILLFWGLITGIKKIMNVPNTRETIGVKNDIKAQKRRMDEIQRRQKQFMEDQKQKIKDLQRL